MVDIELLIEQHKELDEIAREYAGYLYDYGGSLFGSVSVDIFNKRFNFTVGPSTSGMNRNVYLHLDILSSSNISEELKREAEIQLEIWESERKKNTCSCCGAVNYNYLNTF